mgnify:CR=1 FL=1
MAKVKIPVTAATRALKQAKVDFKPHLYAYEEKGGTKVSARALGVEEQQEDEQGSPFLVLMHGDREVSTKALARARGVKTVQPCPPQTADRHSGYQVGGTSPFGTRKVMPVYMEETIAEFDTIYINGGKRGFLVEISPRDLIALLKPTLVAVAIEK